MAVLFYLPKLKRSLGLACGANVLHDFSIKMFLIYSIQWHNFFPSQNIKQNELLSSYLGS